jgi:16S rRNA (guanine966-N2)-methyltransferase
MKVIGGTARGRKLSIPKGARLRATADRTKESLFNILPSLEGKSFLDLFAGTGNIGIEAMSRGAVRTVFVEKNAVTAGAIRKNISACGLGSDHEVLAVPCERGINILAQRRESFDIIFADPPYEKGYVERTLFWLGGGSLLSANGIIAIEHSEKERWGDGSAFSLVDQRKYGDTMISFWEMNEDA